MALTGSLLCLLLAGLCCGLTEARPQNPGDLLWTGDAENYDKFAVMQRNFDNLFRKLVQTNADLRKTNVEVVELHLKNEKLRSHVNQLQSRIQAKKNDTDRKHTSFLALYTGGSPVSLNEILPFRQVMYNDAPKLFGFDPTTGVYRCPYNGTYVFLTNVVAQSVERSEGEAITALGVTIRRNAGVNIVSSLATTPPTRYSGLMTVLSAAGVTACGRGDEVAVYVTTCNGPGSACTISGNYYGSTHFTGFRLY